MAFTAKKDTFHKKDGTTKPIICLLASGGDSTYDYRDVIKNKFKASWIGTHKCWGWFVGDNNKDEIINNYVKPCLEYLNKQGNGSPNNIIASIDKLIYDIESGKAEDDGDETVTMSAEEVKNKLKSFKEKLVSAVSSEEFKQMLEPIIKFGRALGYRFSFKNSLLIYLQDPNAKMVKSRSRWADVNRSVKDGAPAIWMWVPMGKAKHTKEEKDNITKDFLRSHKVSSINDLTPGQKEELKVQLNAHFASSFKLLPYFFDYRYTEQIPGTEDLVGNPGDDVPWYESDTNETEKSINCIKAMLSIIENAGVNVSQAKDLRGALGVSLSGKIKVLQDSKQSVTLFNTLVHEFAHEILHQTYLRDSASKDYAQYYIQTKQGRDAEEQQAEVCAWMVLNFFGYDLNTSINYAGMWGLNERNAAAVFDTVAKVANTIIIKMEEKLSEMRGENNTVNESRRARMLNESQLMTGRELAYILGYGKLYDKSEHKQRKEDEEEREMIKEQFFSILNNISKRW